MFYIKAQEQISIIWKVGNVYIEKSIDTNDIKKEKQLFDMAFIEYIIKNYFHYNTRILTNSLDWKLLCLLDLIIKENKNIVIKNNLKKLHNKLNSLKTMDKFSIEHYNYNTLAISSAEKIKNAMIAKHNNSEIFFIIGNMDFTVQIIEQFYGQLINQTIHTIKPLILNNSNFSTITVEYNKCQYKFNPLYYNKNNGIISEEIDSINHLILWINSLFQVNNILMEESDGYIQLQLKHSTMHYNVGYFYVDNNIYKKYKNIIEELLLKQYNFKIIKSTVIKNFTKYNIQLNIMLNRFCFIMNIVKNIKTDINKEIIESRVYNIFNPMATLNGLT